MSLAIQSKICPSSTAARASPSPPRAVAPSAGSRAWHPPRSRPSRDRRSIAAPLGPRSTGGRELAGTSRRSRRGPNASTRPAKTGASAVGFRGRPGSRPKPAPTAAERGEDVDAATARERGRGGAREERVRSKSRAASSTPNARRRGDVGRPREGGEDGRADRRGGRPLRVLYASLFVIWGAVLHHGEVYSHVVAQRRCLVAARRERDEGDGDRGPAVGG